MPQSNDPITQNHIHEPPNPQLHSCKQTSKLGNTILLSPTKVTGSKKITIFSLEIKLEPSNVECTTANIYIHKISEIRIYMIKYSSLQILFKPFVCLIGMTSTQRKEYTSSPKPHSKRVIPNY
jgi:hypothetical protein